VALPVTVDVPTLRRMYRAAGRALTEPVDPAATGAQLRALLLRHHRTMHGRPLAQLVVAHPHVDADLLRWSLARWPDDPGIWNAVATRPGPLPADVLRALLAARAPSVRRHAALVQLRERLRDASAEAFLAALRGVGGDHPDDAAARLVLATHPDAPDVLLRALADTDDDAAGDLARARLGARPSPG
jgi:hypothetical protein